MRCFRGFALLLLEYCSAVWCSAADTHLKLLDRVVRDASFLTVSAFECDLAHRRSVAVLCMLYKIRWNPIHLLHGALPVPYVPVRVKRFAVIAHRYTFGLLAAGPRSTALLIFPCWYFCESCWYLGGAVFDGVGLAGFKSKVNDFLSA